MNQHLIPIDGISNEVKEFMESLNKKESSSGNYIKVSEAARTLRCHRITIYRWIEKGYFETVRIPGSRYLISRKSFEIFVSRHQKSPTAYGNTEAISNLNERYI